MDVSVEQESKFKLKHMYINDFSFKRPKIIEALKLEFKFSRSIEMTDDSTGEVTLSALIVDNSENFKLEVNMIGVFQFEINTEADEDFKKSLFERNSVAILFPYIRSQITLLTSQPDLTPIILPTLNINLLLDENTKASSE